MATPSPSTKVPIPGTSKHNTLCVPTYVQIHDTPMDITVSSQLNCHIIKLSCSLSLPAHGLPVHPLARLPLSCMQLHFQLYFSACSTPTTGYTFSKAGYLPIELVFFNENSVPSLKVQWTGPADAGVMTVSSLSVSFGCSKACLRLFKHSHRQQFPLRCGVMPSRLLKAAASSLIAATFKTTQTVSQPRRHPSVLECQLCTTGTGR